MCNHVDIWTPIRYLYLTFDPHTAEVLRRRFPVAILEIYLFIYVFRGEVKLHSLYEVFSLQLDFFSENSPSPSKINKEMI